MKHRTRSKALSWLLTLALLLGMAPAFVGTANAATTAVSYIDVDGSTKTQTCTVVETQVIKKNQYAYRVNSA